MGCIFIDKVRKHNLVCGYNDYVIDISNPCVTGETLILTDKGYYRIDSLVGKEVNVWNGYRYSKVVPRITGHNQKMLHIELSNGMSLDCTEYHKWVLKDGSRVEANKLKIGDSLMKWEYPIIDTGSYDTKHDAYTNGFYSGDGTRNKSEICIYGNKDIVIPYLNSNHVLNQKKRKVVVLNEVPLGKTYVPSVDKSIKYRLEWLAGLIDSDGCINNYPCGISISSIDKDFLKKVQLMLSTLGCFSSVSIMHKAELKYLPKNNGSGENAEYYCKTSYRLNITSYYVTKLIEIGLKLHCVKIDSLSEVNNIRYATISSISKIDDEETVYCFTEPLNHTGVFNGIMTAQCAEYFANDGNSCLLQSINLYNIVEDKFTDNAHINYDKLKYLVRLSVDMMNQTQDYGYSMQPLDKNRKNIDDWRSIGLGVFALADMFIAMKVKYGSDESIKLVSDIFDVINMTALDESAELAKKYGTYGKYDWNKQKKSPIIKALLLSDEGKKVYNKIKINGLRNSSLISVAPTGTISLFMGKFSGGVEPLFRVGYDRTTHSGEDNNFVFRVFAHSVDDLLKLNNLPNTLTNEEIKKKFPWVVESQDITPIDRIRVQSVMQDYVDNAISSTINLPEGTSAEKIFDIYVNAWKQGLKGITVFVDNCKRGNILGVNKKEPEFKYDSITPISRRGVKEIGGATYRLRTACVDKMYLTVNKTDDGDIFEVFANPSAGCTSNIMTITRLVSMALRSGIKVEEIIKELSAMKCPACQALIRKGEKDIELSCGNAIAKALKLAYNTKETHSKVVEVDNVKEDDTSGLYECPECHHKTLKLEAKCAVCNYCGYSKCN